MYQHVYETRGTCSRRIFIELDGEIIKKVSFEGGCHGNTQGIAKLVEGRNLNEVIRLLKGIKCGGRPTSCPDQLATALEQIALSQ